MKLKHYTALLLVLATLCTTIFTGCDVVETTVANFPSLEPISDDETTLPCTSIPKHSELPTNSSGVIFPYGLFTFGDYIEQGIICMRLEGFEKYGGYARGESYLPNTKIEISSFKELAYKLLNLDFTEEEVEIIDTSFLHYSLAPFEFVPDPYTLMDLNISFPEEFGEAKYYWQHCLCEISFEDMTVIYLYPTPYPTTYDTIFYAPDYDTTTPEEMAGRLENNREKECTYEEIEYYGAPAIKYSMEKQSWYQQTYEKDGQKYYLWVERDEKKNRNKFLKWFTYWDTNLIAVQLYIREDSIFENDISAFYDITVSSEQK